LRRSTSTSFLLAPGRVVGSRSDAGKRAVIVGPSVLTFLPLLCPVEDIFATRLLYLCNFFYFVELYKVTISYRIESDVEGSGLLIHPATCCGTSTIKC
jgi:hypothetical protein